MKEYVSILNRTGIILSEIPTARHTNKKKRRGRRRR
jgi:hypothetical protein